MATTPVFWALLSHETCQCGQSWKFSAQEFEDLEEVPLPVPYDDITLSLEEFKDLFHGFACMFFQIFIDCRMTVSS